MRILAIETIDQSGSVAVLEGDRPLDIRRLDSSLRSAATLAPAIVDLLTAVAWRPADVQTVAVAIGPGSFTGLRVGITTAKMFAYAVNAEVVAVNTMEAIAQQAPNVASPLWTVLDALREQVVAAKFCRSPGGSWEPDGGEDLLDNATWIARLSAGEWVSGPGLGKLESRIPAGITIVDRELWSPNAITIGQLGFRYHLSGRRDDLFLLLPRYSRASAAEEKMSLRRQQQIQQQQ
jgi:tRNA threonylcarbamoyladenosine biosynthesis protein TsaB